VDVKWPFSMHLMTPYMAQINFFSKFFIEFQRLKIQISHNFVYEIVQNVFGEGVLHNNWAY
jgi:hypothetical protein